jgi:hypothetical protein
MGHPQSGGVAAITPLEGVWDSEEVGWMREKRSWEAMTLRYVGHVSDTLRGGGGKLSIAGGDPGDFRKPSGGG